jgi:hypothetical protein
MTFLPLDDRRLAALGLALAAALATPAAAAQQPGAPPDLPPVAGPPVQVAPEPPKGAPPAAPPAMQPQPVPPGAQSYPYPYPYGYGYPPPGLSWMSPNEVPPGFAPNGAPGLAPQKPRTVDDYNLPEPPPRRRYNQGMWVGGILMVVGGLASVITGAALVSTSANRIDIYCDSPSFPCAHKDDDSRKTGGVLFMAAGAVVGAAGIPLWLVGSKLVPLGKPDAQPQPGRPALVPEIKVGAGTATVTVRF